MDKVGVIIPAAGKGTRMGSTINKQFLKLQGIPVLLHTLNLFQSSVQVEEIVVVGAREDIPGILSLVREHKLAKVRQIVPGGKERQDSVFAGVQALSSAIGRVVVHDGARPLLRLAEFHRFLAEAQDFDGAVMAVPLKDTVKRVDSTGLVIETPVRESLKAVQTPQVFSRKVLERVHVLAAREGHYATDDASLLEWQGIPVKVLPGTLENIKITTPEDLTIAEYFLAQRVKGKPQTDGG